MIDGYVSFRMSFFPRHHCFFFFFFSRNLKYRLSLLNVVQRTIKRLAIRDYPRIPTYGQDSGRHRPTIDRRCIALKKKKKDVFLAAAYRGVPLSTSSSPTYSYVFTYVTTRLSRSPVLFVRRIARGIEGERCGPKKKKEKESDLSSSRNGREPYALSFAFFSFQPRCSISRDIFLAEYHRSIPSYQFK